MSLKLNDTLNLIITGVGGQGNILISKLIGEAMMLEDYMVTIGETYGASQRGGAVASHVRISRGIQSGAITPEGQADIILGLEPIESLRILGLYGRPKTFVITNTRPILPMVVATGEAEYPPLENIKQAINELSKMAWHIDASSIALSLGAPIVANIVMMGALVGTGLLPITREKIEQRLKVSFKEDKLALNLQAFEMGFTKIQD